MTRKHFEAIATSIAKHRRNSDAAGKAAIDAVTESLAAEFVSFNSNFNADRFRAACMAV